MRRTNPAEAERRAEAARKLHYAKMAHKSVKARRLKARLLAKKNAGLPGGKTGAKEPDARDDIELQPE